MGHGPWAMHVLGPLGLTEVGGGRLVGWKFQGTAIEAGFSFVPLLTGAILQMVCTAAELEHEPS